MTQVNIALSGLVIKLVLRYNILMFGKKEIKKLQEKVEELSERIQTLSERQNSQYTDIMMQLKNVEDSRSEDELYDEAFDVIQDTKTASTSLIQRSLGIGYSRAAKLIDLLEKNGVVGPARGSKPREILIKEE